MSTEQTKIKIMAGCGLLLTAVIWGFAFVVVKDSLDLIPASYMLAYRFSIAAVVLAAVFYKKMKNINRTILKEGMVLGIFLFSSYLLQTIGCNYTTAGKNAFLTTIYVILVPFLSWIISRKKPDIYCVVAAVLATVGIGLLSLRGDLSMNIGDVLTLICGFGFAIHMIYIDRYSKTHDPVLLTVLQLGTAAVCSWIAAPIMDGGIPAATFSQDIIRGMLYLGLGSTMLAFLLQNVCQKYTPPNATAILLSMESVFGVVFSALLLHEVMSRRMAAGCILMFAAVIIAETKLEFLPAFRRKTEREHV